MSDASFVLPLSSISRRCGNIFTFSYLRSGQTEGRQEPSSRGGELPEADARSAPRGGPDPPGGEEEGWEREDHEWGGPREAASYGGLKWDHGVEWKWALLANMEQLRVNHSSCVFRRQLSDGSKRRWRRSRWRWSRSKWKPCECPSLTKCLNAVWSLPVKKGTDPCDGIPFQPRYMPCLHRCPWEAPWACTCWRYQSIKVHLWPFRCSI